MVTRISGLASGMDIDSMVKSMLQVDRIKVDKVKQNKQSLEWKQQLYNDINKEFAEFIVNAKKEFGLMTSKLSGIGWHKQATSSNEDAVTANVSGINSFSGTHTVNVIAMAEGVDVKSSYALGMKDWTVGEGGNFKFTINGKNIEVSDTDNLSSIARKINSSGAGVVASYDSKLDRFFLQTSTVGSNAKLQIAGEKNENGSFKELSIEANDFLERLKLGISKNQKVSSVDVSGWSASADFEININGNPISVSEGKNISELVEAINSEGIEGVSARYDETDKKLYIEGVDGAVTVANGGILSIDDKDISLKQSTYTGVDGWKVPVGGIEISIGKEKIVLAENDTLATVASKINSAGISGLSASYDSTNKKFNVTGNSAQLDAIKNAIKDINGIGGTESRTEIGTSVLGSSGIVSYNGLPPEEVKNNTFTFNGVTFTAKTKTASAVTVTITPNIDTAIEKITKFVDEYNKMLDKAGSLIGEKANRNYQPLTDEQKEAMTEKEIELWEERAKKGLLSRDSSIANMLSTARSGLYQSVKGYNSTSNDYTDNITGTYSHITEIGITTQEYASGTVGGKLKINETKLREALANDADSVLTMLFKEPNSDYTEKLGGLTGNERTKKEAEMKRSESGLFTRLVEDMSVGMKEIISKSGAGESSQLFRDVKYNLLLEFATGKQGGVSTIQKQMNDMSKQIDDLNVWLFNRENSYYSRFTAMEKAMQNANNQSSWLYQQMGM